MKKLFVPVLALAAGFAGGWFVQKRQAPAPTGASSSQMQAPPAVLALAPAPGPPVKPATPADATPEAKTTAAKANLDVCRDLWRKEKNPARATVKILALLDTMDVESITALAGQVSDVANGWYDSETSALLPLVYGRLAEMNEPAALQTAMKGKDLWSRMSAVGAVVEQMARTNPGAVLSVVEKLPAGYLRRSVLASAAATIARTDGPAAAAMLQRAKIPPTDWAWGQVIGSWTARDPSGAAAQLLTLPRQAALNNVDSLAIPWARRDPGAAMAWAQSVTDPALRRAALNSTINAIAQSDPEQAIALAGAQPAGDRRMLMTGIASSLAQSDGPAALAWAQTLTDPAERHRCLRAVAEGAGFVDTDTAAAAVNLLPAGAQRNEALENLGRRLSWENPLEAQEWALKLKPGEQALVMRDVVTAVAGVDPSAAEKLADSLPASGDNQWAWRSIAGNKALQDPVAALTWAGNLDTEQARVAATDSVFYQWASHSPDKAAAALAGISDANIRRQATEKVAATWAERSPAEATRWAESLTGEDRIAALSAVWNSSANDDPRAAGQSLASAAAAAAGSATATDKLASSASTIAAAWAGQSPADAAAWAGTLPDGKIREQALGQVAGEWARYDPAAVSEWINGLPHDRSRDAAISQLVDKIVQTDPESAFTWAASVENTEKQTEALKSAALAWKAINPDAARAAVQNARLPEDIYNRLQEVIR